MLGKNNALYKIITYIVVLCAIGVTTHASYIAYAQSGETIAIETIRKQEGSESVEAVTKGIFELQDVVNIYVNGVFINSEAVDTEEELAGTVVVTEIPLSKFPAGTNLVIARLNRLGTEIHVSPSFQVVIEEVVEPPIVQLTTNEDIVGEYTIRISGFLLAGDVIELFSNREAGVIQAQVVSSQEASEGEVSIENIGNEALGFTEGENSVTARIRRGTIESELSTPSEIVTIAPIEVVEPEPEPLEPEVIDLLPKCFEFDAGASIVPQIQTRNFGLEISRKGKTLAVTDSEEKVHIHEYIEEEWQLTAVIEDNYPNSNSAETTTRVEVVHDTEIVVSIPFAERGLIYQDVGLIRQYRKIDGVWRNTMTLEAPNPQGEKFFGRHIATDGNTLVTSALRSDNSGIIYVYKKYGEVWVPNASIIPSDSEARDNFGEAVNVSGGVIAVGTPHKDLVYTYQNIETNWVEQKIGTTTSYEAFERRDVGFGSSILLDGNTLIVADRYGTVTLHTLEAGTWNKQQEITEYIEGRRNLRETGIAIQIFEDALLLGFDKSDTLKTRGGEVRLYRFNEEEWVFDRTIGGDIVRRYDNFGTDISFSDDIVFIASSGRDTGEILAYTIREIDCDPLYLETEEERQTRFINEQSILLKALEAALDLTGRIHSKIQVKETPEEEPVLIPQVVHGEIDQDAARGIRGPGLPVQQFYYPEGSIPESIPEEEETEEAQEDQEEQQSASSFGGNALQVPDIAPNPPLQRTYRLGDNNEEIYDLQVFLNSNGFIVSKEGVGSVGSETNLFDIKTQQALSAFQSINGISVTGELDAKTREVISGYSL